MEHPQFHFFSYRTAIRFHITRQLEEMGWRRAACAKDSLFSDKNLILNDEISKNLEYKHLLARMINQYCQDLMPTTYEINDANYADVFAKIIFEHQIANPALSKAGPPKWILKPSLLNNGDNIKLFHHIDELKRYYASNARLGGEHVIQSYIKNPDLIENRKYTFRVFAVLTNYAGVFLYRQGYINISNFPFELQDFVDRKIHITNYVIDGEFANIEQRSTQTLKDFSDSYAQMCQIVKRIIKALLRMYPNYLAYQHTKIFEIFGFDFIRDEQGKIWLLEINQGPDTPTFEDNKLDKILWQPFWHDIIHDFVLPNSIQRQPHRQYENFCQLFKAHEVYPTWRKYLALLNPGIQ